MASSPSSSTSPSMNPSTSPLINPCSSTSPSMNPCSSTSPSSSPSVNKENVEVSKPASLSEKFEPFQLDRPQAVYSSLLADSTCETVATTTTEEPWEKTTFSLRKIRCLACFHPEVFGPDHTLLVNYVLKHVQSLRSGVARESLLTLRDLVAHQLVQPVQQEEEHQEKRQDKEQQEEQQDVLRVLLVKSASEKRFIAQLAESVLNLLCSTNWKQERSLLIGCRLSQLGHEQFLKNSKITLVCSQGIHACLVEYLASRDSSHQDTAMILRTVHHLLGMESASKNVQAKKLVQSCLLKLTQVCDKEVLCSQLSCEQQRQLDELATRSLPSASAHDAIRKPWHKNKNKQG